MGYRSRILRVNLTDETISTVELSEEATRKYIGGSGLASKIIWEETSADTDPLSPKNVLVVAAGPLTGTSVPQSSRYTVSALSPLTGIWGEAHSGGRWGHELKHTGFDGMVFTGKAKRPVYLWVSQGKGELRDASALWGRDTYEVSDLIQAGDEQVSVACIGPAGEKLVPMACVMNDGPAGRAAARCGLGAVMGSKNLKAIAVKASQNPPVADPAKLRQSTGPITLTNAKNRRGEDLAALAHFIRYMQEVANLPVQNWRGAKFESFVVAVEEKFRPEQAYYCKTCACGCMESHFGKRGRELVWEAFAPMGSLCLVDDVEAMAEGFEIANRQGVDSISLGAAIAFGMEVYENGLVTKQDTGGVELKWGNARAMVEMTRQICQAEGFGKLLGQGVKKAAEAIGGKAHEYAIHVKGLEVPAHDPRAFNSLALAYATANRGACHVEAHSHPIERPLLRVMPFSPTFTELGYPEYMNRLDSRNKGAMVAKMQNLLAMVNSLVCCDFVTLSEAPPSLVVHWINCVTGWDMTPGEFMKNGEHVFNLKRLINNRRGISRKDDTLPPRLLSYRRPDAGDNEAMPDLELMLKEYYDYRGWTAEGTPSKEKLTELELPSL